MNRKITIVDNGQDRYTITSDYRFLGRQYDNKSENIVIEKPAIEADNTCIMIVKAKGQIIAEIIVEDDPIPITNSISQYKMVTISFAFINEETHYVKNSQYKVFYFDAGQKLSDEIEPQPSGSNKAYQIIDKSVTNLAAKDLQGATKIGAYAFYNCDQLESIVVPTGVTLLDVNCFSGCSSLVSIILPNTLVDVQGGFFNCSSLTEITFPSSLLYMGGSMFGAMDSLETLRFLSTNPPSIGSYTFNSLSRSVRIEVPEESLNAYKTAQYWSNKADQIFAIVEE